MKNEVLSIVDRICNTESNCRGLTNNQENINALLSLKGIDPSQVTVYEVPLNWNNQVIVLYVNNETNEHRELFAGIGLDGKFYFVDGTQEEMENF